MTRLASRLLCQASASRTGETSVKSFDNIPGPKSLPLFGTLHKYLPVIGKSMKQKEYFFVGVQFCNMPSSGNKQLTKVPSVDFLYTESGDPEDPEQVIDSDPWIVNF